LKAQGIMTHEVATVKPETSEREIAALMMGKNILYSLPCARCRASTLCRNG